MEETVTESGRKWKFSGPNWEGEKGRHREIINVKRRKWRDSGYLVFISSFIPLVCSLYCGMLLRIVLKEGAVGNGKPSVIE